MEKEIPEPLKKPYSEATPEEQMTLHERIFKYVDLVQDFLELNQPYPYAMAFALTQASALCFCKCGLKYEEYEKQMKALMDQYRQYYFEKKSPLP